MDYLERLAHLLGGRAVLGHAVQTWADLDRLVQEGLPKQALQVVASRIVEPGAPVNTLVYSIVPPATFKRREKLSADESERTERLARTIAIAEAIWDDEAAARAFLNRPHPLLEGRTPLSVARTELGARRVEQILYNAEHGLPV